MCRLTLYKGKEILVGDLIIKPENSLIRQSRDAHYHPGVVDRRNKRNILVNGDGFGVAWYGTDSTRGSCVFKFITPAWSNNNLRNLGEYIYSSLIMAHVRAASSGHDHNERVIVSNENCHPFKYGRWTFMHNGGIPSFDKMKRGMINRMSNDCFLCIHGSTDSEYIFALFLTYLTNKDDATGIADTVSAVEKTIATILELCAESGITEPCSLNLVISDGINVIATRYRNGFQMPPSLYYKYGSEFTCHNGRFDSTGCTDACEVVISSAPLSGEDLTHCVGSDPHNQPSHDPAEDDEVNRHRSDSCYDSNDASYEGTKCNWTLIPKDNMLVCLGDPENSSKVISVYLKPIKVCAYRNKGSTPTILQSYSCSRSPSEPNTDDDERSSRIADS